MAMVASRLQITGLRRKEMVELTAIAKNLRLTPERYAKKLIQERLALEHIARTTTFAQLMMPVRKSARPIDEEELIRLVDEARDRHHAKTTGEKR